MTFLMTLIALIIERFFHWSHLRHWHWFTRYQHFLSVRMGTWSNLMLLVVAVLPPVIVFAFVGWLVSGWFYNIPKLIFGVLVLLYCFGPNNLWVQIYNCIRALNKEDQIAAMEEAKNIFALPDLNQPQTFHQSLTRAIFIAANQRIFAVIFWFVLLGPAGAVLYRAVSLCATNASFGVMTSALQIMRLLDWIPVRIFTFLFALVGAYTKVWAQFKTYWKAGVSSNDAMLGDCGVAALAFSQDVAVPEDGSAENEALMLLDRAFVLMLVILAAWVLMVR